MNWTKTQIKQIVEKYPYLAPHNSWTGKLVEDYDYSYTEAWGIPEGWHRLFYMLCKELRPHIEKAGLLDKFYFTQVKEKYGTMRVYTSCLPNSVDHMIDLYETFSKYICQNCGEFAKYQTQGWIAHLCDNCNVGYGHEASCLIRKQSVMTIELYEQGHRYKISYTYKYIKQQYKKIKNMSEEEFFNYLMT